MAINNQANGLKQQIEREIQQYLTEVVQVGQIYDYSQYKLVRRIALFESHTYPTGKFDTRGNYKFWFDIVSSRIYNEVKNIDFDTKDIVIYSDRQNAPQKDDLPVLISNLKLKEYLRETGQAEEINSALEQGSGWGNIVWKKVKGSYERVDLRNFYVINQTAQDLDDTPVIERHEFSARDLRAKSGSWENIKDTLQHCKKNTYKTQVEDIVKDTTTPFYEIYERNGDVCLKDLKEALGQEIEDGDEDEYVFAKVIAAASNSTASGAKIEYLLFVQEMPNKDNCDLYAEFHRGVYRGTWWREGMYELLFDLQVRANQVGNQIAQGLEYASKVILQTPDKLIVQNVQSDLNNGDIIRTTKLEQVPLALQGMNELIAEWNRIQQHANDIANSSPIVTGEGLPQRMPFQEAALLNQNANKLFDYIRQKLAIPFTVIFEEWIVPELVASLKTKDFLRLTGDPATLARIYAMIVDDWYLSNLVAIGPHGQDVADFLKQQELQKLIKNPNRVMQGIKAVFKDFEPSVSVVITGENSTLPQDLQTLQSFIQLEEDPVRRSAMIEMAMAKKGIDVASLPKGQPQQPQQGQQTAPMQQTAQPSPTAQPTPKKAAPQRKQFANVQ